MRSDPPGTDPRPPAADRRTFIGGLAGLGAAGALRGGGNRTPSEAAADLAVMTRNLYLGVDLARLYRARSAADVRRIAGSMLADVERRPFPPRAGAIADEVTAHRPDVLGVQEAALVRRQEPSDFAEEAAPNAEDVSVDFLEVLVEALEDRGLRYEVASATVTADVEVPADVGDRTIDVRLTDRDALLIREGVDVAAVGGGTYDASLEISVDDHAVTIERGYATAVVALDDERVTVATTHLESADTTVRLRQARELLDVLPADGPVVLAGDVNSGPGGSEGAYRVLTDPFADAHEALREDADGDTCCGDADLRSDDPGLTRRVDVILSRDLRPVAVERVGDDSAGRVAVDVADVSARLWPSDHAGVVATFEAEAPRRAIPKTPTSAAETAGAGTSTQAPAATTTRTRTERTTARTSTERTTAPAQPGFGALGALAAVLLAAASKLRRREVSRRTGKRRRD